MWQIWQFFMAKFANFCCKIWQNLGFQMAIFCYASFSVMGTKIKTVFFLHFWIFCFVLFFSERCFHEDDVQVFCCSICHILGDLWKRRTGHQIYKVKLILSPLSPHDKSLGVPMWRLKRKGRHVANQYKPLRNETKKLTINISHRQMITINGKNGKNDKDSNKEGKKNSWCDQLLFVLLDFGCGVF